MGISTSSATACSTTRNSLLNRTPPATGITWRSTERSTVVPTCPARWLLWGARLSSSTVTTQYRTAAFRSATNLIGLTSLVTPLVHLRFKLLCRVPLHLLLTVQLSQMTTLIPMLWANLLLVREKRW